MKNADMMEESTETINNIDDFYEVKVPTWIDNSKEGFFSVGARFEPMLESKENDAIKTNLPFRPIFAVHQITRHVG
ncbi:hypothetical protein Lser_V15G07698 [Lactuca serriola]